MNNQNSNTNSPQSGNDQSGSANKQDPSHKAPGQQQQPPGTKTEQGSQSDRKDSPGTSGRESSR